MPKKDTIFFLSPAKYLNQLHWRRMEHSASGGTLVQHSFIGLFPDNLVIAISNNLYSLAILIFYHTIYLLQFQLTLYKNLQVKILL